MKLSMPTSATPAELAPVLAQEVLDGVSRVVAHLFGCSVELGVSKNQHLQLSAWQKYAEVVCFGPAEKDIVDQDGLFRAPTSANGAFEGRTYSQVTVVCSMTVGL
jgi:hypothetical protein